MPGRRWAGVQLKVGLGAVWWAGAVVAMCRRAGKGFVAMLKGFLGNAGEALG